MPSFLSCLRLAALSAALLTCGFATAQGNDKAAQADDHWCPPSGPTMDKLLRADNGLMLRPGWVTLRMRVRPGAVPVSDVRVVSEAGGPSHARVWLPLVRQWKGCAENMAETRFDMRLAFAGPQGNEQLPKYEGFGLYAFRSPQGAPALPKNTNGIGVCPIKAKLKLRQPDAANEVLEVESAGGAPVADWLAALTPRRDYMEPNPAGNRIEFPCRVKDGGEVFFYEQ